MAEFKRMIPLLNIPLKDFPKAEGRYDDLYEIRAKCTRADGFFLVKCDTGDYFESSFALMAESAGAYMLGQIIPTFSKQFPDRLYYDVFIHGGACDAVRFCTSPADLLDTITLLEEGGMEHVFVDNEAWEATEDMPFDELFTEFAPDARFAMMFGPHALLGDDPSEDVIRRLQEYLE